MPHITMESGVLNDGTREALIAGLSEKAAEITGIPRELFSVTLLEVPDNCQGIGGATMKDVERAWKARHED